MSLIITYSSISSFISCRQKYDYRYNLGIVPNTKAPALLLGSAVHVGLEIWFKYHQKSAALDAVRRIQGIESQEKIKALELVSAYIDHYQDEEFYIEKVEYCFMNDIVNPQSKRRRKNIKFAGKIDGLIKKDGKYYILEHKTVSNADETYFMCKAFDSQITLYAVAIEQALDITVSGALYDVLIKPSTRWNFGETDEEFESRKQAAKDPKRIKRKEADSDETFTERVRTAIDESNFIRCWIDFNAAELAHKKQFLWNVSKDISDGFIYQNTTQCLNFGACEYALLCKNCGLLEKCRESFTYCEAHEELMEK